MGVIAVFVGTVVFGATVIFIGCAIVYVIGLLLQGMFYTLGGGSTNDPLVVYIEAPKPTAAKEVTRYDREVNRVPEATRFFEDVNGIDLEYRGVGANKGSS